MQQTRLFADSSIGVSCNGIINPKRHQSYKKGRIRKLVRVR
jgi:hypothetical protein